MGQYERVWKIKRWAKISTNSYIGSGMDYPRVKFDTQFMPTKLLGFGRACPRAKIYTHAHAGPGIHGYPDPWVKLRSLILFMKKKGESSAQSMQPHCGSKHQTVNFQIKRHISRPHQLFEWPPHRNVEHNQLMRCHCNRSGLLSRIPYNEQGNIYDELISLQGHYRR